MLLLHACTEYLSCLVLLCVGSYSWHGVVCLAVNFLPRQLPRRELLAAAVRVLGRARRVRGTLGLTEAKHGYPWLSLVHVLCFCPPFAFATVTCLPAVGHRLAQPHPAVCPPQYSTVKATVLAN